jgi:Ion channel
MRGLQFTAPRGTRRRGEEGFRLTGWISHLLGGAVVLAVLADVFLTVLCARSGTSVFSERIAAGTWRVFRGVAACFPRAHDNIVSYCGPTVLVVTIGSWVCGLLLGFALLLWPGLGTDVQASRGGPTPTDFATALYVAGYSMTTMGNGDFSPQTAAYKLLMTGDSILGITIITLTLTYLVDVYSTLQRRTVHALALHHATGSTGDAVRLLAGLGAAGNFNDARSQLDAMAHELEDVYESHHFHSSLLYFRFREPYYGVPRVALLAMETATLIRTALDEDRYRDLRESRAVTQLWEAGMHLLVELSKIFVPPEYRQADGGSQGGGAHPDPQLEDRWRRRYAHAAAQLRRAGISTAADPRGGADAYVALRRQWHGHVAALGAYLAYDPDGVDPAGAERKGEPAGGAELPSDEEMEDLPLFQSHDLHR